MTYVGRFAPSPTGPLHVGSLLTAVTSYLHAKRAGGEWLVRIEDIDPPRESPGAADDILRTLDAFDLHWDRSVLHQSTRHEAYEAAVADLLRRGLAFLCSCSRSAVRAANVAEGSRYPGTCRAQTRHDAATAVRVRVDLGVQAFVDGVQGEIAADVAAVTGDYVVRRRDGLPAYHLAVVLDDAAQGVTAIVRGVDLLDSTGVHLHLQRALGLPAPAYWHTPVVVNAAGDKLSKQTGAAAVAGERASDTARRVLELLGARVPGELVGARPARLWEWALARWRIETLRGIRELREPAGKS
ncbi:MAG TPA: tRNA glutamyl-Q(34) synthetase GluQRS [Gammaproteobacteria bacterium]|nr:tRNA glutamyl-Q(34) synthetase GluQRS [Gammaproteobacteria bacterium]